MIRFKSLKFKNAVTYDSMVSVPLDNLGRVFLSGDNKDTGGSNGAGKSTIFEVLNHVLFSNTTKGYSRGKFAGNGYRAQLAVEVDGHDYIITQFRGATNQERKDGYKITKDGTDVTPKGTRHMQDCINYIKDIIGITEAEFRGYIYLAQEGSGHVLISGKGSEKRTYLSDLFTLDRYDLVKEGVEAELSQINAKLAILTDKVAAKEELKAQLVSIPFDDKDFSEYFVSLTSTKEFVDKKHIEWSGKLREADTAKSRAEERSVLESKLTQTFPKWKSIDIASAISKRQSKLRSIANTAEKLEELAELLAAKKGLEVRYIEDLNVNEEQASQALNDLQSKITLISEEIKMIQRRLVLEERLPDVSHISSDLKDRLKSTEAEIVRMKMTLKEAKDNINRYSDLDGAECPTCGQSLDVKAIQATKEKALQTIKSLEPAIARELSVSKELSRLSAKAVEHEKIMAQIGELPKGSLGDRQTRFSDMKSEAGNLKRVLEQAQENARVSRQLADIADKLSEFESLDTEALPGYRDEVSKLEKQIAKLRALNELKKQLDSLPAIEELEEEEYSKIAELAKHYDSARADLSGQISDAKSRKDSYESLSARVRELDVQLADWETTQKRKTLFEAMKAAYGPKGLKVIQLKKVCEAICNTLPKYTSLMFQEPRIEFFVDNDPDSVEIDFYIRRFTKHGVEEYPVGKLSGGERKRLAVAFIFALADLVAPRKKCNLIILDEVGDALDSVGEYAFSSQLLPQLAQQSVIVTSHRPGIQAARFDKEWVITKEDNRSVFQK